MAPEPSPEDDEQYLSEEDSDFAPDETREAPSEHSDSDDEAVASGKTKRSRPAEVDSAQDDGYDNSGDEAIIAKGHKRRKRAHDRGEGAEDDEGGEGGLVKTRAQRAAEKEERKYTVNNGPVTVDVDVLWAQMMSGAPAPAPTTDTATTAETNGVEHGQSNSIEPSPSKRGTGTSAAAGGPTTDTIRIKRTYNFAGQVHTEEKEVARDSAEAKLYLASQGENGEEVPIDASPPKRATRKAFRSAFEPIVDTAPGRTDLNLGLAARIQAGKDARAKKLNTVEKSRMDWAGYVDKEGIKDELELASKSKGSYAARQDFLARSEAIRDDDARKARIAGRT